MSASGITISPLSLFSPLMAITPNHAGMNVQCAGLSISTDLNLWLSGIGGLNVSIIVKSVADILK